jgi:hypothetical protein
MAWHNALSAMHDFLAKRANHLFLKTLKANILLLNQYITLGVIIQSPFLFMTEGRRNGIFGGLGL